MMKKLSLVQLVALSSLFSVVWAQAADASAYTVYKVEPAITNQVIVAGQPLPAVCQPGEVLQVSACRGEYEPASFVVVTEQPLEAVRIEVGTLRGPGGELPREAVDVRIVKPWPRGSYVWDMVPWAMVLVKNDAMLVLEPDPTPDYPQRLKKVAPNGLRDSKELQPAHIEDLKQFWITVHVPDDAQAGTYTGRVRIVPENAPATELELQVAVHGFQLHAPMLEYSLYYPVTLVPEGAPDHTTEGGWTNTAHVTPRQYLLEMENMQAHGITNPNIYGGVNRADDGTLDYSKIEALLALREQAGFGPNIPLYMMSQVGEPKARPLSDEEKQQMAQDVRQIMAWGKRRGYPDIYLYGLDEAGGPRLAAERDSFEAIHAGGGKVIASCGIDYFDLVGDLLDLPVLMCDPMAGPLDLLMESLSKDHPRMLPLDDSEGRAKARERLQKEYERMVGTMPESPVWRRSIDGSRRHGYKVYTYGFPWSGHALPATHRRKGGLAMWQMGFDGATNWAFAHIRGNLEPDDINQSVWGYVIRTEDGVLDELHWEGLREGVDDVRYLTTLLAELNWATGVHGNDPLVVETWQWLHELDAATVDLGAVRAEMARRITALRDMGNPIHALADIDLEQIEVVTFPEPWPFKLDAEGRGVDERWFDPQHDTADWTTIRTDLNSGWHNQGFDNPLPGNGWYRAKLPLTEAQMNRKFIYLYFEAADEEAFIYLNGKQIAEHTVASTGLVLEEVWTTPFHIPLNDHLNRDGENLLAVRVYNTQGMGGLWKPVHVVLSDQELTQAQLLAFWGTRDRRQAAQ